jgi:hypothetical protein
MHNRVLRKGCVAQNPPYVTFGSATSFYKRQEIKTALASFKAGRVATDVIAVYVSGNEDAHSWS